MYIFEGVHERCTCRRWNGHNYVPDGHNTYVHRMKTNRITNQALEYKQSGQRGSGRPKERQKRATPGGFMNM
jgi:hypothetical protein